MTEFRFEWDEAKNLSNQCKHGLRFEEAAAVFLDPLQVSVQDRIENGEARWQTFGMVDGVLLVTVAHTVHKEDQAETVVRILSARRADRKERRFYEDENGSLYPRYPAAPDGGSESPSKGSGGTA